MPRGQYAQALVSQDEINLWNAMLDRQNEVFTTFGRGSRSGVEFTYEIKGAEMFVSSRSKFITRSTILYAYHKVKGCQIGGPKAIGVHGDSYIYAVFKTLGVINK